VPAHRPLIGQQQVGAVVDKRGQSDRVDRRQPDRISQWRSRFGPYRRGSHDPTNMSSVHIADLLDLVEATVADPAAR
jgi:hypothetical protein